MALIVQKFGGTSVANIERMRHIAGIIQQHVDQGHQVAVVVSAMAGETNKLVEWVREASPVFDAQEYDVVVSSGEQVSCGLMALVLQDLGIKTRSWLAWQAPIRTTDDYGKARITEIGSADILKSLKQGEIPVIAGFQGLSMNHRITTLGRGGSDTTAVALAAALQADWCDIYTDVDGVYTADPRIVPQARKINQITYEEMLEMASLGAKVLQTRSVELAMKHGVKLRVLSSFSQGTGTWVVGEEEMLEQALVSGITCDKQESKISLTRIMDKPGAAAAIFGPLAEANINVDMIVQNISSDGQASNLTFTVNQSDFDRAMIVLRKHKNEIGYHEIIADPNVVKISVVGVGMRSHAGIAQKMFKALAERAVNIQAISTSEIKISVLIPADYTELALRALHATFELDKQ